MTIVGVAGDTRQSSLTNSVGCLAYVLYTQQTYRGLLADGNLVVRTKIDPGGVAGAVRSAIRAVNPDSAPTPRTMVSVVAESLARQRFQMEILGAFAVLAQVLATVGLYGSHFLYCDGEPDTNRHPAGAGRAAFHHVPYDYRPGAGVGCRGRGAGSAGMHRAAAGIGSIAVRHRPERSGDNRDCSRSAAAGSSRGSVLPRAPRHAHRPDGGATGRVVCGR